MTTPEPSHTSVSRRRSGWLLGGLLLMAGASVTQVVGALLRHGPERLAGLEQELSIWLMEHEVASVAELVGCMSQQRCPNPAEYERAQYMRAIQGYRPADARQAPGPW